MKKYTNKTPTQDQKRKRKLTDAQVKIIRNSDEKNIDLAKKFNVSAMTISLVKRFLRRKYDV